jgi:hypothetical protein
MKATGPVEWIVSESEGEFSFRWGYSDGDLVAEWGGLLTLRATRDGALKTLHALPGVSPERVEKARNGVATAFLRAQRGQHSLHASAITWEGRGLVCVGPSGQGKSTMADRLCRRAGFALLADDVAAVELAPGCVPQVVPTESVVWLGNDPSEDKAPVAVSRVAPAAVPLSLVACLSIEEDSFSGLNLRDLRGGDAFSALLPSLIRFERTAVHWAREFDFLSRIVSQCRIVQITRSRRVPSDTVAHALVELMAGAPR